MVRLFSLMIAGFLTLGSLAACNTVEGFGKDLQAAGSSLQKDAGGDEEAED